MFYGKVIQILVMISQEIAIPSGQRASLSLKNKSKLLLKQNSASVSLGRCLFQKKYDKLSNK
jgi:hypothetical protein